MYAWGQFIDHDLDLEASDSVNHIDVNIPSGDDVLPGNSLVVGLSPFEENGHEAEAI